MTNIQVNAKVTPKVNVHVIRTAPFSKQSRAPNPNKHVPGSAIGTCQSTSSHR